MEDDIWYLWPDGYMVSIEETQEFEEALLGRSDDFSMVIVTKYDETDGPCEWLTIHKIGPKDFK